MKMQRRKQELEELKDQVRKRGKKFVSYREGADLYSLGLHTFEKLAKDANAIYRVKGRVLINIEIIDEYMETFHEFDD
jgi:hypothetical protein